MELAIAGLGRMGGNMARRLHRVGHRVIAYNRTFSVTEELMREEGLEGAPSAAEAVAMLAPPRIVWLMVPAGDATEQTMEEFAAHLAAGDTIIDGGNANFHDSKRRHALLKERGIHFVDAGISGGIWGLQNGYGTMVGGDREAVAALEEGRGTGRCDRQTLDGDARCIHCSGDPLERTDTFDATIV